MSAMFLNFVWINFQGLCGEFKEVIKSDVQKYNFKKSLCDLVVSV